MKQLLSALLFLVSLTAFAQNIPFEKTFEDARRKSQEENKPLLVLITMTPPANVTDYLSGFYSPEASVKFKESFVSYRTTKEDCKASCPIISKYKVSTFPAFIFIDSKGGLLFKDFGHSVIPDKYLRMAERALALSKEKSILTYDNEYALGNPDSAFLREYISRRITAGFMNNARLIDEYVDKLTVKDLEDYHKVLFILEAGPTSDSKAYRLVNTDRKIIDSIFKTEPLEKRKKMNNTIINNSLADAIALKSPRKAESAASFTRNSWGKNYQEGQKHYTLKMLQYYRAVNDTSNYFPQASFFYDQYYMRISADSIKRREQKQLEEARAEALKQLQASPAKNGVKTITFTTTSSNSLPVELNNAAYTFYQMGTKNANHLTKAVLWSKRSIELDPQPAYYDTLAHLLYRLGFFAEAESTQEKAITLARSRNLMVKSMQDELEKIQKKTL